MPSSRPPVLVLDGYWRKSLAAIRGLSRKGWTVWVGEDTPAAPALHSKFPDRKFLYPSPQRHPEAFIHWLTKLGDRYPGLLLLPLEDTTIYPVLKHRNRLRGINIPFPSMDLFHNANHKFHVLKAAKNDAVFRVPKTVYVSYKPYYIQPLNSTLKEIGRGSWIIKPCVGSGARGVRYGSGLRRLKKILSRRKKNPDLSEDLVQKKIENGTGTCVSLLLDKKGDRVAGFVHRRLREWPVRGGASTLRESIRNPELVARATRLLRTLNWWGVGQVELRKDSTNDSFYLMEINPRFWGSLRLPLEAGINFPHLLCSSYLNRSVNPPPSYRDRVRSRWFLPGDLLSILSSWIKREPNSSNVRNTQPDFGTGDVPCDLLNPDDWAPAIARVASALTQLTNPVYRLWDHWEQTTDR